MIPFPLPSPGIVTALEDRWSFSTGMGRNPKFIHSPELGMRRATPFPASSHHSLFFLAIPCYFSPFPAFSHPSLAFVPTFPVTLHGIVTLCHSIIKSWCHHLSICLRSCLRNGNKLIGRSFWLRDNEAGTNPAQEGAQGCRGFKKIP